MADKNSSGIKIVVKNKKAFHEYHIVERYEAGVVLKGTEVKSVRAGKVNFQDAYAMIRRGEAWLHKLHISPYSHGNRENHEPLRTRKLLLHSKEILKLSQKIKERGFTLVPLAIYLKGGLIKVEIALCRGKNLYDKRKSLEKKDTRREVERVLRDKY